MEFQGDAYESPGCNSGISVHGGGCNSGCSTNILSDRPLAARADCVCNFGLRWFQNSLSMWLSKYISVYLWLPISDLFSAIIARLQTISLQNDAELAATGYDWYFDTNSTIYLVFMLVAICGYFCIPSIASWVVQTNGIGSYNRAVGTMAAFGGGVVGYSAGKAWSTTKAGGRGLAKFGKFLFTKSE